MPRGRLRRPSAGIYTNLPIVADPYTTATAFDAAAATMRSVELLEHALMTITIACVLMLATAGADEPLDLELTRIEVAAVRPAHVRLWMPDCKANARSQRGAVQKIRKKMATSDKPGGPGGMAGDDMAGLPPGGMGGMGGMPLGGPSPESADPLSMMSQVDLLRAEMDFARPLDGDLRIASDGEAMTIGRDGAVPRTLNYGRNQALNPEDGGRAFAMRENGALVVEINTDDGVQIVHTYTLEDGRDSLRVTSQVFAPDVPIPGGIESEHIYRRAATQAASAP